MTVSKKLVQSDLYVLNGMWLYKVRTASGLSLKRSLSDWHCTNFWLAGMARFVMTRLSYTIPLSHTQYSVGPAPSIGQVVWMIYEDSGIHSTTFRKLRTLLLFIMFMHAPTSVIILYLFVVFPNQITFFLPKVQLPTLWLLSTVITHMKMIAVLSSV